MQRSLPVAACFIFCLMSTASALDGSNDWQVEKIGTGVVYSLTDDDTSLSVTCTGSHHGGGAMVDLVLEGLDPSPFSTTEILIDDRVHEIRHGAAGIGITDCPECAEEFVSLWAALRRSAVKELKVMRGGTSVWLDARGGGQTLGDCPTDFDR